MNARLQFSPFFRRFFVNYATFVVHSLCERKKNLMLYLDIRIMTMTVFNLIDKIIWNSSMKKSDILYYTKGS